MCMLGTKRCMIQFKFKTSTYIIMSVRFKFILNNFWKDFVFEQESLKRHISVNLERKQPVY